LLYVKVVSQKSFLVLSVLALHRGTILSENKMDEETYSVIFTSLKHPIRRRILRMLASKPLTFSEIMESLSIDSGHLSYHLESVGDLVMHVQDGKYQLSNIGIAAVRLMSGVEEHPAVSSRRRFNPLESITNIYPFILAAALVIVSLYFITYATQPQTYTFVLGGNYAQDMRVARVVLVPHGNIEKPYLYYGIVGFVVALGYLALIASGFLWRFRKARVETTNHLSAQSIAT
jgi:DNA-binding transcriptional ArsR family regulator